MAHGYDPLVFSEIIDLVAMPETADLDEVAQRVFERLLNQAVQSNSAAHPGMFDPAATEIGVGLRPIRPEGGESFRHLYMVTVDIAAPTVSLDIHLLGVIYADENNNNLFDAGEGLANLPVFIDYPHQAVNGVTDPTGGIDRVLGPGDTRIVVWPDGLDDEFWVTIDGGNCWFSRPVATAAIY